MARLHTNLRLFHPDDVHNAKANAAWPKPGPGELCDAYNNKWPETHRQQW